METLILICLVCNAFLLGYLIHLVRKTIKWNGKIENLKYINQNAMHEELIRANQQFSEKLDVVLGIKPNSIYEFDADKKLKIWENKE